MAHGLCAPSKALAAPALAVSFTLLGAFFFARTALAQPPQEGPGEPTPNAEAPPESTDEAPAAALRPLAVLPEPPSVAMTDPEPNDLKALDGLLSRIADAEPMMRERAVRELLEAQPRWVAAIHTRLDGLADTANKVAMRDALERIRTAHRREMREGEGPSDYLSMVVERAEPESETWRHLVHALAMSRMLRHINTTVAARSLVHVYVRYGEFLRINTQLELEAMGDRSLAALIEARRHQAQKIAQWAERQLDLRGKAIAGEALRTDDPQALADILRAFGRIRDPDAARIIISFAQSERALLRGAAREALVLLGEVATWQLRDAYESTMGKRAPREWSWQRTARELFTEFDRLRQAEEHDLFEAGLAAHQQGDLPQMREKYDRVLAFNPMFERRDEMSAGYLDYARKYGEERPADAVSALRRAERVSSSEEERKALLSLRLTFEAQHLLDRDLADQGLIHQALALDPNNQLAERTLETAAQGGASPLTRTSRYWGASVIAGISLLGACAILWAGARRRRLGADGAEGTASEHPPSTGLDTKDAEPASNDLPHSEAFDEKDVDLEDELPQLDTTAEQPNESTSSAAPSNDFNALDDGAHEQSRLEDPVNDGQNLEEPVNDGQKPTP